MCTTDLSHWNTRVLRHSPGFTRHGLVTAPLFVCGCGLSRTTLPPENKYWFPVTFTYTMMDVLPTGVVSAFRLLLCCVVKVAERFLIEHLFVIELCSQFPGRNLLFYEGGVRAHASPRLATPLLTLTVISVISPTRPCKCLQLSVQRGLPMKVWCIIDIDILSRSRISCHSNVSTLFSIRFLVSKTNDMYRRIKQKKNKTKS